jgi:hypothetical protein
LAKANGAITHVSDQMNVVGHQNKTPAKPMVTDRAVEKECNQAIEYNVIVERAREPPRKSSTGKKYCLHDKANRYAIGAIGVATILR